MSNTSAIVLLLAFFFGWLGYRSSLAFRATRGVTPWHLPSFVWALICFFFMVIGLLLELVAQLTTRPTQLGTPPGSWRPWRPGYSPPAPPSPTGAGGASAPPERGGAVPGPIGAPSTGAAPAGVSPAPWGMQPSIAPAAEEAAEAARVSRWPRPPAGPGGGPADFGWYGDPAGRHESRYFDGRDWTQFVRDGDRRSEDRLEP